MRNTAEEQVRQEIRKLADEINDAAYATEENRTELQSEEIVSELVHRFLIPEVYKMISRDRVKLFQSRHRLAAHRIIHDGTKQLITVTNVPVPPPETAPKKAATEVIKSSMIEVEERMQRDKS